MKTVIAFLAVCALSFGTSAQQQAKAPSAKPSTISLERFEGGGMRLDLNYEISLNKDSTLKREWFVVRDDSLPAYIEGNMGIRVQYKQGEIPASGRYVYNASYVVKAREAITAVEARVIVIDIFGRVIRTLSTTDVFDLPEGQQKLINPSWRIYSESEASEAFASISYVAQVRTQAGKVYEVDRSAVLDQVRKVARKITDSDLDPKREHETK